MLMNYQLMPIRSGFRNVYHLCEHILLDDDATAYCCDCDWVVHLSPFSSEFCLSRTQRHNYVITK